MALLILRVFIDDIADLDHIYDGVNLRTLPNMLHVDIDDTGSIDDMG